VGGKEGEERGGSLTGRVKSTSPVLSEEPSYIPTCSEKGEKGEALLPKAGRGLS